LEVQREIEEKVLRALREITRANSVYSTFIRQRHGLTVPQLLVLRAVAADKSVSGSELARSASVSHATVTGILSRLEKKNLIRRDKSTEDRRKVLVAVTDKGRELLEDAPTPLQSRFLHRFRRQKDWEQYQILSSLERVAEMTQTDELEGMVVATVDSSASADEEVPDSVVEAI